MYVSSQAAAGPAADPERPVSEDDPPQPFEPYGRSKLEAETLVREHPANVPWTIVRPSAVYGPGDGDFLTLFRQAAHGVGVYPGSRARGRRWPPPRRRGSPRGSRARRRR